MTFKMGTPVPPVLGPMHLVEPDEDGVRVSCTDPLPDANQTEWYWNGSPTRNLVLEPSVSEAIDP